MTQTQSRALSKSLCATLFLSTLFLATARPALAQYGEIQNRRGDIGRTLGRILLNNGIYIPTSPSAGLTGTKFYNQNFFHKRILSQGNFELTAGGEFLTADDKFFPFTGGNQFGLFGASIRLKGRERVHSVFPHFTAGLYMGRLRSETLGFDVVRFTPSVAVGATWQFGRNMALTVDYRISQQINGINTDGLAIAVRLF